DRYRAFGLLVRAQYDITSTDEGCVRYGECLTISGQSATLHASPGPRVLSVSCVGAQRSFATANSTEQAAALCHHGAHAQCVCVRHREREAIFRERFVPDPAPRS